MKNLLITAIITAASGVFAIAQTQQAPSFILNQYLTGNQHYKASQFIEMGLAPGSTTGFEYNAQYSGGEFKAEIDPFMVFPPTGGELGGPIGNENIVGNDGVVGATKGSLSVNDAGSAVYQVPLEFPGGISGMTPELSLIYNSSGSDGILGPGWSLGGLSVITCVPATRYHNGIKQAAFGNDFEDGAYTLDGQRLVPVLYKNNINFREYRTEMNVFSKIMRKANTSGGKDEAGKYFEVITKTGLTYIYGKNDDSRHTFVQEGTSDEYTVSYYVSSIIDNMGNKINFEYNNNQDNGEISIKSIKYTYTSGTGGSEPIYSIDFGYKPRPDVLTYYLVYKTSAGDTSVKTSTSKVIEKITCTHSATNTLVKEYVLEYSLRGHGNDATKKTLHLNAIQEFGKNKEEKYNKTVFEWEDFNTVNFNNTTIQTGASEYKNFKSAPYDICCSGIYTTVVNYISEVHNVRYFITNSNKITRVYDLVEYFHNGQCENTYPAPYTVKYSVVFEFLEEDILRIWDVVETKKIEYQEGIYYKNYLADDFGVQRPINNVNQADFNGDGNSDFILTAYKYDFANNQIQGNEPLKNTEIFLISNFHNNSSVYNSSLVFQSDDLKAIYPADYNGDGITDIMYRNESDNKINFLLGSVNNPLTGTFDGSLNYVIENQEPYNFSGTLEINDFNGDGRADIFRKENGGKITVYRFIPLNNNTLTCQSGSFKTFEESKNYILLNLNKDSKPDFAHLKEISATVLPGLNKGMINVELETRISTGINTNEKISTIIDFEYSLEPQNFVFLYDINAQAFAEIVPFSAIDNGQHQILLTAYINVSGYDGNHFFREVMIEVKKCIYLNADGTKFIITPFGNENFTTKTPLDFNSDNKTDFYNVRRFANSADIIDIKISAEQSNRINKIINSLGHETTIEYAFTGDSEVYTPGAEAEYPVIPYEAPRCLVKKIHRSNGQGGLFTEQYKYEKARAHTEGLGFIGFEKITKTDVTRGIESITDYGLDAEFFVSYPSVQTTKLVNGPIIEQTFNEYIIQSTTVPKDTTTNLQTYSGRLKYYFVRPVEMKTYSYELKTNETESYNYKGTYTKYGPFDTYGNPSSIVTEYEDFSNTKTEIFRKSTQHTYAPADTLNNFNTLKFNWILGRLTISSTEFEAPGVDKITKKSEFSYYPPDSVNKYGMLFEEREYKYNSDFVLTTKRYSHDKYGNITTSTFTAEECTSCATITDTTKYTDDGRFIDELINPMGHKTIKEYDSQLATLRFERFETDESHLLTTEYRYDGFGRLEKGIAPDGTISASALRWVEPGDPQAPANSVYYSWQQTSGKPAVKVYYNSLGMELRSVTDGFNNILVYVDSHYNEKGQLWKKSAPYNPLAETPKYAENTYDRAGRVKTTKVPDDNAGDAITTNIYNGFTISTTNALNQTNSKTLNAAGWTVKSTDNSGNSVIHTYYADGAVKSTEVEGFEKTRREYKYDNAGNPEEYKDASQGTIKYVYNAYGQIKTEINANNDTTTYNVYDKLGRLRLKTTPEGTFSYYYDQQKNGLLDYVEGPGNIVSYTYDDFLRPISETETDTIGNETFVTSYEYDELGRLLHQIYPSGYKVRNTYTYNGYPLAIIDTEDGKKLWEAKNMNARGQYAEVNAGDIKQTFEYYEKSGRIWKIKAEGLQSNVYAWDKGGNLKIRNTLKGRQENFLYDNLNRLKEVYHNYQLSFSYRYDALGNITHKSDVGDYTYENDDNPYELTSINNKPATINSDNQEIFYNSFNKVYKITEKDPATNQIKRQLDLLYGVDYSRIKQVITENGVVTSSKLYIGGSYEVETKNGETSLIHYINAPTGLVAIVTKKGDVKTSEFVLNDHLGSLQVLATRAGELVEEFSYDAWGMRRDPATFEVYAVVPQGGTAYGFTGHEHIDLFMLVNMDGRMYDPVLGRFLSPDPVLQFPNYTQGLNPYSYALNNPLRFVDPNGYSLVGQLLALTASTIVGIVSGGNFVLSSLVYSVIMTIDHAIELGRAANFGNLAGYFMQTFVMSTISAGATKVIGDYFDAVKNKSLLELRRALAHGTFNGAMRLAQGGKFHHGFLSGFVSSLGGSYMDKNRGDMTVIEKIAISAAIGGTAEALGGGKFANGAVTGAYVMAFNHLGGEMSKSKELSDSDYEKLTEKQKEKYVEMPKDAIVKEVENTIVNTSTPNGDSYVVKNIMKTEIWGETVWVKSKHLIQNIEFSKCFYSKFDISITQIFYRTYSYSNSWALSYLGTLGNVFSTTYIYPTTFKNKNQYPGGDLDMYIKYLR